ncbi:MAG: biotin--[acetyl-CoA-carboxylase] ligase [Bacteroidota bacterium]
MYKILAKTLILGKKVVYLPSCHSTNDSARSLTKSGVFIEGSIVIANDQTAGRGQMENSWESAAGANLTFSLILKPTFVNVNRQFQLAMAMSLGVAEFLDKFDPGFQVKWPNDVYYGKEKIAGILIQNSVSGASVDSSIVGIGLNINQTVFETPNATSLRLICNHKYELSVVLEDLCFAIEKRYLQLKRGGALSLKNDYLQRLLGYGNQCMFNDGELFQGEVVDVLDNGRIAISRPDGVRHYDLKQIKFIF